MQSLFIAIEAAIKNRLDKNEIKQNTAFNNSTAIRTALSKPAIELSDGLLIEHVKFKTKLYMQVNAGRELVSDLYDEGCLAEGNPQFAQQISKIEFTTEKEYIEKALEHLEHRLNRIKAAAWDTISQYYDLKKEIRDVMSIPVPLKLQEIIDESRNNEDQDQSYRIMSSGIKKFRVDEVSSGLFNTFVRDKLYSANFIGRSQQLYGSNYLYDRWIHREPILRGKIKGWVGNIVIALYFIPPPVLTAARILFILHSGWNNSSVESIKLDNINITGRGAINITSIKSRSDQIEEMEIHPEKDKDLYSLCNLLTEYQSTLQDISEHEGIPYAPDSQNHLFATLANTGKGQYDFRIGHKFASNTRTQPRYLFDRYNIAVENIDQIRTQINQIALIRGGNVEEIRSNMNHADIATTGIYLTTEVTKRMNDSRLMLFKKQLEAGAVYAWGKEEKLNELNISPDKLRKGLYFPVGNGLSCNEPINNINEYCEAESCLECKSKKFIINKSTIEQVVRLKHYYNNHWRRLLSENLAKFKEVYIDNIVMNQALYEFIESSEASDVLKEIEGGMQ